MIDNHGTIGQVWHFDFEDRFLTATILILDVFYPTESNQKFYYRTLILDSSETFGFQTKTVVIYPWTIGIVQEWTRII